jgi:stage V sporulation protein SpoVS
MLMRVASRTRVAGLAGAIANHLRDQQAGVLDGDDGTLSVQAVGPLPIYTAATALGLAQRFVEEDGIAFTANIRLMQTEGSGPRSPADAVRFEIVVARP